MPLITKDNGETWFQEGLFPNVSLSFKVSRILFEQTSQDEHGTPLQQIKVLDTPQYGRVLTIDDAIQTTEQDNAYYHEPIVHCPLLSYSASSPTPPKNILLIGCDGGTLREAVKYSSLEQIDVVDIDRTIIDIMKKYMPSLPNGSFDDPRVNVTIADGAVYVKEKLQEKKQYDVIVVDSPDPQGVAISLFRNEFYQNLHDLLTDNGITIRQTGSSLYQPNEMPEHYNQLKHIFQPGAVQGFVTAIPTYHGGYFTLVAASKNPNAFNISLQDLIEHSKHLNQKELQWYTPQVHLAAMQLPLLIKQNLEQK